MKKDIYKSLMITANAKRAGQIYNFIIETLRRANESKKVKITVAYLGMCGKCQKFKDPEKIK